MRQIDQLIRDEQRALKQKKLQEEPQIENEWVQLLGIKDDAPKQEAADAVSSPELDL